MFRFFSNIFDNIKYSLVISGGGTKGFYALGVLKGIEKIGLKNKINVIYGVSIGAIIGAYRCSGYSADQIFQKFINFKIFGITKFNVIRNISLLKNTSFKTIFEKDLPKNFGQLKKKLYIGATDTNKGKFILFNKGEIINPLLGSIAIPGIFPNILYKNYSLIDGGASNNFPVEIAKTRFPKNRIIGINLNKFSENQQIKTIFDNLSVSLEILLRTKEIEKSNLVDYLFYKETGLKILDINKSKMEKAFEQGYVDCLKKFK